MYIIAKSYVINTNCPHLKTGRTVSNAAASLIIQSTNDRRRQPWGETPPGGPERVPLRFIMEVLDPAGLPSKRGSDFHANVYYAPFGMERVLKIENGVFTLRRRRTIFRQYPRITCEMMGTRIKVDFYSDLEGEIADGILLLM